MTDIILIKKRFFVNPQKYKRKSPAKNTKNCREYKAWAGIKTRCLNSKNKVYKYYGGRGITVCERWLKFENFLADMGLKPSAQHSIDRIDNNGNYEPSNCRWATDKEQTRNRRSNIIVEHEGVAMCMADAAELSGVGYNSFRYSLQKSLKEVCTNNLHK